MMHVVRIFGLAGPPTITAALECDACGRHAPVPPVSTGPDRLAADRIRLRIAARGLASWAQHSVLMPAGAALEELTAVRIDVCPGCRRPRRRPWA